MTDYASLTDREIDALVAERVMGCQRLNPLWKDHVGCCGCFGRPHDDADGDGKIPHFHPYSSSGDGLLAVIERMRELGWEYLIEGPTADGSHFVEFTRWEDRGGEIDHRLEGNYEDPSLPRAVALAALRAVGNE